MFIQREKKLFIFIKSHCDNFLVSLTDADLLSGSDRLLSITEDMTGHRPSFFFKFCWKFVIPLVSAVRYFFFVCFIYGLNHNKPKQPFLFLFRFPLFCIW